ncbi:MAG: hypothetical protein AAF399_24875 [Bacteroidota bacterium]
MPRSCSVVSLLILCSWILVSCGEIRPLWKGTSKLEGFTMYYSEPCEYLMDLSHLPGPVEAFLELEITYYVGTNRTNVPLFLVLENKQHDLKEHTTNVILKADGEWVGIPAENEIDYSLSHIAIPYLRLQPDEYVLRVYANDDDAERLYGIVEIAARLFETQAEAEASQ